MKGWGRFILAAVIVLTIWGCASSFQENVVQERLADYKVASKAYHETEEEYLTLLFNLERMPDDPYLLQRKKELMAELVNLRAVMLQSRSELDDAVQRWEAEIQEERGVEGAGKIPSKAFGNKVLRSSAKQSSSLRMSSSLSVSSSSSRIVLSLSSAMILERVDQVPSSSSALSSSSSQVKDLTVQTP